MRGATISPAALRRFSLKQKSRPLPHAGSRTVVMPCAIHSL